MSTPRNLRFVPSEWRNVLQPTIFPLIPALIAAGLITFLSNVSGQTGTVPLFLREGKRKSVAAEYCVVLFQPSISTATGVWRGTGFALARVFYTEGKSLIFYAFDLDDKRVVNANYSYQAWGERLGQPASVKSLGMLYVDDKAERRWSLKVDDPHQLSEINSVFVTLEPRSGEGDKPRGKRILFAFLGSEANHP